MDAFELRILAIDAALENTGYCTYGVNISSFAHRITDLGAITTEAGLDTDTRVAQIIQQLADVSKKNGSNCWLIEQPPQTLYVKQGTPVNQIIGRAASVFSVFAAAFGIMGYCYAHGIYHRMILPVHWQPHFAKSGTKKQSKVWSIKQAKQVLQHLNFKYQIQSDHEADAVNIGRHAILQYYHKKWEVPNVSI